MTPKEYVENATRTESSDFPQIRKQLDRERTLRILHAGMGTVTEAGELMDALKKHIFYSKHLDEVNVKEEIGDLFWYIAVLCDSLDVSFEEIWETNIAKLKARYGEKFNKKGALERDLEEERRILEEGEE